jgi:hypothetical protein
MNSVVEVVKAEVIALAVETNFVVTTPDLAKGASDALGKIKTLSKQLEQARKDELAPVEDQIRTINAKYTEPRDLLFAAERTLKGALLTFRAGEEKRLEDERKAAAAAALQERARLEEQARKQRAQAAVQADKLQAKGHEERAQAVREAAELQATATEHVAQLVAAPVTASAPTKLDGTSVREIWRAKVVDPKVFLANLLESPYDLIEVVEFKASGLNKLAGTLKGKMDTVLPGSISWPESVVAARAK